MTTASIVPFAGAAPQRQIPTILGSEFRRRTAAVVNGLSRGVHITVKFMGSRAFTNGRAIVLPNVRDLAEIKYETARALMGYAVHEVAHVRYTDFAAIERIFTDPAIVASFGTDDKREIGARLKLIKKFENCIEDYRIERELTREYPGTKSDLEALRIAIHPKLKTLTTAWFRDPRSCGPLALTWTGARINGYANPHLQRTLDFVHPGVMEMIDDWTTRMTDVQSSAEVVDLAIVFEAEAQAYALATREEAAKRKAEEDAEREQQPDDADVPRDEDPDAGSEATEGTGDPNGQSDESGQDDGGLNSGIGQDENADPDGAPGENGDEDQAAGDEAPTDPNAPSDKSEGDADSNSDTDGGPDSDGTKDNADRDSDGDDAGEPNQTSGDEPDLVDDGAQTGERDVKADKESTAPDEANEAGKDIQDIDFGPDAKKAPQEGGGQYRPSTKEENGKVDLDRDLADEYDGDAEGDGAEIDDASNKAEEDAIDRIESSRADDEKDAPRNADEPDAEEDDSNDEDALSDDDERGAFDDVLDEQAGLEDAVSDAIDEARERAEYGDPLPEATPDATDGEVDPSSLLEDISDANEEAPEYDSSSDDPNPQDTPDDFVPEASKMHYGDARFSNAPTLVGESNRYADLRTRAAGAITTTSRTIRRLLMAEEKSGSISNRRSGDFDIRNISAIARGTGTCYRKDWSRPAPKTLLVTLVDFSGSMLYDRDCVDFEDRDELATPLAVAMTGALAIEQAVRGTSVNSAVYAYTGYSPTVRLSIFKEGEQREALTQRRIGGFQHIEMGCTPTGEAMAAVAARMDNAEEERRILMVLTDGTADDVQLCADVTRVLIKRGIEVVVIGIKNDSAAAWAPVHHMIKDVNELPAALLRTIDPRAAKRRNQRRMAA